MNSLDRYRDLFPVTRERVYFNHAAIAPTNLRVAEAVRAYADEIGRLGSLGWPRIEEKVDSCRKKLAELIGGADSEVAFIKNTSEGISIVANGLNWQKGDQILIPDMEYPANVYPWLNLKRQGVETVFIKNRDGRYPVAAFAEAITRRTRLISVSSVQFATGFRIELRELGDLCRENDILFCVDAIQSLGAFRLNVRECGIDFLAADSKKWLLGLEGIGLLYVADERLPQVRPERVGWANVRDPKNFLHYDLTLQEGAEKFEEGSLNSMSIWGLEAAVGLIQEVGIETIENRILEITGRLAEGLAGTPHRVVSSLAQEERSGILTFVGPEDPTRLTARLIEAGIVCVERAGAIRLSPHFYNNEGDVARFFETLGQPR